MANKKISELVASSALSGSEVLPVVQGGTTKKVTAQAIADLASGGGGAQTLDIVSVGTLGNAPLTFVYGSAAIVSQAAGTQSAPVINYPTININGGMGFTGTLSSITFPTLTVGSISLTSINSLTSISLPALTTAIGGMMGGAISIGNNSALTTVDISALVSIANNSYFGWFGCAFSEATVDNILVQMVATGATGCTLQMDQGTSAAPSATGLAAKATLEGRGWTITVNLPVQSAVFKTDSDVNAVCTSSTTATIYWRGASASVIPNQTPIYTNAGLTQGFNFAGFIANSTTGTKHSVSNGYAFNEQTTCS